MVYHGLTQLASVNSDTDHLVVGKTSSSICMPASLPLVQYVNPLINQLLPQIPGLFAHCLNGTIQLLCGSLACVAHVLCQEILQSLADGVALGHNPLPPLVSSTAEISNHNEHTQISPRNTRELKSTIYAVPLIRYFFLYLTRLLYVLRG